MAKIVMPKNSALLEEVQAVLKVYYDAGDWLSNDEYTQQLKELIGADQYSSSYTKKAQITSYFGFTEWQDITKERSPRRITDRGKRFYEHLQVGDRAKIYEELMSSLEKITYGRNNFGCPSSNSDLEPPALFIRAVLDLGYLTYSEFAYLIWKLVDCGGNYTDTKNEVLQNRRAPTYDLPAEAKKYEDAKPIKVLVRWGFLAEAEADTLTEDTSGSNGDEEHTEDDGNANKKHIVINSEVLERYRHRLQNLKVFNIDKDICEQEPTRQEERTLGRSKNMVDRKARTSNLDKLNRILYGAPGTGKTYATAEYALSVIEDREVDLTAKTPEERAIIMAKYNQAMNDGRIVFTTFHQSYSYEDFVQGLRPDPLAERLAFVPVDGVFKRIADRAMLDQDNDYVIIIDEINRANISKVFGELITLIEADKRWGESNALSVTLPYGDVFAVPNNLFIVGTMNSADKSISLIDTALRRRFEFIEVIPDASVIQDAALRGVLEKLNTSLVKELDSTDLLIGHAYFVGKKEDDLCSIFNRSIIPLLYEYFYDNSKKVKEQLKNALPEDRYEISGGDIGRIKVTKK